MSEKGCQSPRNLLVYKASDTLHRTGQWESTSRGIFWALRESETVELMQERLEAWCQMADQSTMLYLNHETISERFSI
jgi:hypothetical protein